MIDAPTPRQQSFWVAGALMLITLVAYAPLWNAGYIWDDDAYVTENKTLRSADGLRQMWFEPRSIPQYYPLVHTTFWLEYQLWELEPRGYHLVNVLLHGASAILLWRLLLVLGVPGAWLAAAIFAVHPVMVESVAWITERKNVLSLLLALGSMLCYLRFAPVDAAKRGKRNAPQWKYYGLSLALFLAALLSKTVVFSLPAVLLVIYWWKRGRITWADVQPLLPFFALGLVMGSVTAWLEKTHVGAEGDEWSLTAIERVLLAGRVAWFYAGKLAWPQPLMFFYPRWQVDQTVWWQYTYPLSLLAVLLALFALRERIGRGPLAAVLIFCGVLTPALGFFDVYPFRYSFVADHFQYHASIGLITLAAAALTVAAGRLTRHPRLPAAAAGVGLVVLAILTWQQTSIYKNLETLYLDTIAKNSTATAAYANLADHLVNQGRTDDALEIARKALEHNPNSFKARNLLGGTLLLVGRKRGFQAGELAEAIEHLNCAAQEDMSDADVYFNLATALTLASRHDEAVESFEKAQRHSFHKDDIEILRGLVYSLVKTGRAPEAQPHVERLIRLRPDDEIALLGLGTIQLQQGQLDAAAGQLQAALERDPKLAEAHFELGNVLAKQRDFQAAAAHYGECLKFSPYHVRAMNNLGVAHMNLGQTDRAIESFSEAVRLAPGYEEARSNLERAQEFVRQAEQTEAAAGD